VLCRVVLKVKKSKLNPIVGFDLSIRRRGRCNERKARAVCYLVPTLGMRDCRRRKQKPPTFEFETGFSRVAGMRYVFKNLTSLRAERSTNPPKPGTSFSTRNKVPI
jgi:hypothetical protein